jgi:hypothetical protein
LPAPPRPLALPVSSRLALGMAWRAEDEMFAEDEMLPRVPEQAPGMWCKRGKSG